MRMCPPTGVRVSCVRAREDQTGRSARARVYAYRVRVYISRACDHARELRKQRSLLVGLECGSSRFLKKVVDILFIVTRIKGVDGTAVNADRKRNLKILLDTSSRVTKIDLRS
jgi:hypothetical protein